MKSITTFDVVLVPFPFSDLSSAKRRPCVVFKHYEVKKLGDYLCLGMITSQLEGLHFPGDVSLKDWSGAGLPKPSLVRIGKLVTIEQSLVQKKLGTLKPADQVLLQKAWKEFFSELRPTR